MRSTSVPTKRIELRVRSIGPVALFKLLVIGYAAGALPFIVLLNVAFELSPPAAIPEVQRVVAFPGVLIAWPVLSVCAAWVTTLFVSIGIRLFAQFRPIRISLVVDESPKA